MTRDGLQLHGGGVSVLFPVPVVLLTTLVGRSRSPYWVLSSLAYSQTEAHIDKNHCENHAQASEDSDEGEVDGLHVPGGEQIWVWEKRAQQWWLAPLCLGMLTGASDGGKAMSWINGRWRVQVQPDGDIVGNYCNLYTVFNAVAGVQAALVLPGIDDQQAICAGSKTRVEVIPLHLSAVQHPEGRRQIGAELALQQHVITDPHWAVPVNNIWKTQASPRAETQISQENPQISHRNVLYICSLYYIYCIYQRPSKVIEAWTPITNLLIPALTLPCTEQGSEGDRRSYTLSDWNWGVREGLRLPWISNRFLSRDGKNVIKEGRRGFCQHSAHNQLSKRPSCHLMTTMHLSSPSMHSLFLISLSSVTFFSFSFFFLEQQHWGADEISAYRLVCSHIPWCHAGYPGLMWICEER